MRIHVSGRAVLLAGAALLGLLGCGGDSTVTPTPPVTMPTGPPTPPDIAGVTRGASEGTTDVRLVLADPPPGATIEGCGRGAEGCGGRISLLVHLQSAAGGEALGVLAHLHSDRVLACFVAEAPDVVIPPRTGVDVPLVFGPADTNEACPTPLELTHLAVVVEGTTSVFARQEWALRYRLEP